MRVNATTRLIAVHFLLVALSTGLVLGFVYLRVGGVIDAGQRAVVEAELRGLADDYARGGTAALAAAISLRLEAPPQGDAVYLLATPTGRRIVGNLAAWPPTVAPGSGWVTLELYRTDRSGPTQISALALRLPRGELLLVGRDVASRAAFDRTLAGALIWALAAMGALALVTGWLLARLVGRRIAEIDTAARGIMAGTLDRRIALHGSGDEFDRLASTLNAMLDRIEALVGDLRTVTDSLAHDLRSPLGRLVGHLRLACDDALPEEERLDRIARAQREAESVLATATGLLDIARVEAGIGADQFEPVDLGLLARDLAELYDAVAEDRGLTLVCESSDTGPVVSGHRQLLAQAATNLLDNALGHAPPGSTVVLTARMEGGRPVLAVTDRGPGIPEADRGRVLQRFVRLDPSRGGSGTGLGLALVAAVARMHGTDLVLEDADPGLRATLRFPGE